MHYRLVHMVAVGTLLVLCSACSAHLFDVNDDDAASPTMVGWRGVDATNINNVTFTAVGNSENGSPVTIDDRLRAGYGGDFADMWLDFIFANGSNAPDTGMNVIIGGLPPNTAYNITLWMFDTSSNGARSAFWNGNVLTFDGNSLDPTTLDDYSLQMPIMSNESGNILLEGRANEADSNNNQHLVFLNGFEITDFNSLTLRVDTVTGSVRITNTLDTAVDLNYYEIRSPSGSLDDFGWSTLDSAEGDDPVGTGWDVTGGSSPSILSETNLQAMSTLDMSGGELSLGSAFSAGGMEDLVFRYAAPDGNLAIGLVEYVSDGLPGDYNNDGRVGAADYTVWRDGLGDEFVQDDYTVWKNNFGAGAGVGSTATAVPEPTLLSIITIAGLIIGLRIGRGQPRRYNPKTVWLRDSTAEYTAGLATSCCAGSSHGDSTADKENVGGQPPE